jgi:TPR repeat protein
MSRAKALSFGVFFACASSACGRCSSSADVDAGRSLPEASVEAAAATATSADVVELRDACDANDPAACGMLGYCFAHGEGVQRDDAKAVELYRTSCDAGVGGACGNLGFMFANGRGVARDDHAAFELYERACKAGSLGDCTNLANAFELGHGTNRDLARARALFAESCAKGDAVACDSVRRLDGP